MRSPGHRSCSPCLQGTAAAWLGALRESGHPLRLENSTEPHGPHVRVLLLEQDENEHRNTEFVRERALGGAGISWGDQGLRTAFSSELQRFPLVCPRAGHMTSLPRFPPLLAGSNRSLTPRGRVRAKGVNRVQSRVCRAQVLLIMVATSLGWRTYLLLALYPLLSS